MAGSVLRDAFRTELVTVAAEQSISWAITDAVNTDENPATESGFLYLEFGSGSEEMLTFGSPGNNLYLETATVFVRIAAPLTRDRDNAESYGAAIRAAFRGRRFTAGGQQVKVDGVAALGGALMAGGMWIETVALSYQVYNIG